MVFPLDKHGGLERYSRYGLTDEETKTCERYGFCVSKREGIVWASDPEFEATLKYDGFRRGCSSATFWWVAVNNENVSFPMFMQGMDKLIRKDVCRNVIHGLFTVVKRGSNYGIELVKVLDNENDERGKHI